LIGCGAIAQAFYLPVIAKHRARFGNVWLVDVSSHALAGAAALVPARQVSRLADVTDEIQFTIVATPNHLHYPLALEALGRGAHVLIEKPFVIRPAEGCALLEAVAANDRVIAVNQTRRLYPLTRELRRRIREGDFGGLRAIIHREGTKLNWPFESGAGFAPGAERTGVIMDFGVHIVDFYHHLINPAWTFVSAIHDGFHGPEGLAEIALQADGAPVSIRLSRYYPQENVARLTFEHAEISFGVHDDRAYSVQWQSRKPLAPSTVRTDGEDRSAAELLLLNFLGAGAGREAATCDAASSLPVITLLDEVYCKAERYPATLGSV
jgi:predicted dehydrogenase